MNNKTEVTLLGCGSSLDVPRIDGYWGRANKNNPKNYRTRCSVFVKYKNINVIIDTSPDIKSQMLTNKIKKIDAVIYPMCLICMFVSINYSINFFNFIS